MKIKRTSYNSKESLSVDFQKKIELEILGFVINFCKDNDINCFLTYGTLLGAVRHKGFIPWDDDVDVAMLREDYSKFMQLFDNSDTGHYSVISYETDKDYPYCFAKVQDNRTVLFEKNMKYSFSGVYIDVFPLDYVPLDNRKKSKYINRINLLHDLMGVKIRKRMTRHSKLKTIVSDILYVVLCFIPLQFLRNSINRYIHKISEEKSRFVGNFTVQTYIKKEKFPISFYREYEYLDFESIKAKVPKEYDKILTQIYGDYMKLPPPEKRVCSHGAVCYFK